MSSFTERIEQLLPWQSAGAHASFPTSVHILLRMGSLFYPLFPSKPHETWTHVKLSLDFGLAFDETEITENLSYVLTLSQQ
jgi:hypothetical protein